METSRENCPTLVPESSPAFPGCRVIVADDHELYRSGVEVLLNRLGMITLASVGDGREALAGILEHVPDVAILDGSMPGCSGLTVIREARRRHPSLPTRFLFLTMFRHWHLVADACEAGVRAVVGKDDTASELEQALAALFDEESPVYLSESMREVARPFLEGETQRLTARERDVLSAVASGETTKEAAARLGLSVRTVDHHRERLMRKIGARNTADVVRFASLAGLG